MWDVLIVGGGAAGLAAACRLSGTYRVLVAEKQKRVGRKLLATGNGRCNLTNLGAAPARYHGDRTFIGQVLDKYPPGRVLSFFEDLGLATRSEEDGRVYPLSNQAASVLDVLRFTAQEQGCRIETECAVAGIQREAGAFRAKTADGRILQTRAVLLCAGSPAAPSLGGCSDGAKLLRSMGHTVEQARPVLTPLKVDPASVRALKGQRLQGRITLYISSRRGRSEAGELLFGDGALSGIAAMGMARDAQQALYQNRECSLSISILEERKEEVEASLLKRARNHPQRLLEDLLTGITAKRVGMELIKRAGLQLSWQASMLDREGASRLAQLLTDWRFPVLGVQGFESAQAASGGAVLADFEAATMGSMRIPGLFAAGETLDVDGDCGGYNLQWAWASALTAAEGIHSYLQKGQR